MTRKSWATSEQREWLEGRKGDFLESKRNETSAKEFFPNVCKDFREIWPVPPVTNAETSKAGSVDLAMKTKRDDYDRVCTYYLKRKKN
jgi:hypothetical protein